MLILIGFIEKLMLVGFPVTFFVRVSVCFAVGFSLHSGCTTNLPPTPASTGVNPKSPSQPVPNVTAVAPATHAVLVSLIFFQLLSEEK